MNQFNNQQGGFGQQQNGGFNNQQQNFGQQQQGFNNQQQNNFVGGHNQGGGMFIDNNQAPSSGSGTLPKGLYPVRVTNAEYKQNSAQTGWILALENTVISGTFAGRKIFDNYNMQHTNETAQNIGQANYAKLCQSLYGNPQNRPQNPAQLIGGEYVIDYGPQRKKKNNNDQYSPDAGNADENKEPDMEVKDRMPLSSLPAGGQHQQQQQPAMNFNQQQPQQQNFGGQQQQQQQFNQQQQAQNGGQQQGFNGQQQHDQQHHQQQQQQQQVQQQQQQGGFQQGNAPGFGQQAGSNQQAGAVQGSQVQGQNGNGQSNGAPQVDNSANANPGNVNGGGSPFNQGGGNGFGGGFGNME